MRYTQLDYEKDLFFIIGYMRGVVEEDKKARKNKLDEKRFERFVAYCTKRFSANGVITG